MEKIEEQSEESIKAEIKGKLESCPSIEICAKIRNPDEKLWCISYVYKYVSEFGFTVDEAMGQLDEFLNELHN